MSRQTIYLDITPKGEEYFQQMAKTGYPNLLSSQRVEWKILHDLILYGGDIAMSTFLDEGRDSILGRAFSSASQPVIEGYGRTLHSLIKQGYIKAFRKEV